ncbi:hypothetical protein OAQ08_04605 [Alphaproteobacteria bacterium]|nr:hypothetical protein [Alphaproteobacteria bacterium]
MKLFIICTLFILYSCAPVVEKDKAQPNVNIKQIKQDSPLNIKKLNKIIILINEEDSTKEIFYEEFTSSNLINSINDEIVLYYTVENIPENQINNSIIIGPTKSEDLLPLKEKLGENNLILSLTNDLTFIKNFNKDEIFFLGMSPFFHILKLREELESSTSIGVLYKQNLFGVRVVNFLKNKFKSKYIKSSSYTGMPEDINFAVQDLGSLIQYDAIVLIDDTFDYKNVLTSLTSNNNIYEYDKTYLVDNFLEQRASISSFYSQIKRTYLIDGNLEDHIIPHREYFFRASVNIAFSIAHEILKTEKFTNLFFANDLGYLEIKENSVNYPILFK